MRYCQFRVSSLSTVNAFYLVSVAQALSPSPAEFKTLRSCPIVELLANLKPSI
ncbi:MAG: hypothetical protein JRM78_04120 [Nitrososphaerota archaeon]|nr:hypothetical protein [Nitrososphaerota archaeon]MDG7040909.1 hypothetical protein [Nitrososphaerota archaeon]